MVTLKKLQLQVHACYINVFTFCILVVQILTINKVVTLNVIITLFCLMCAIHIVQIYIIFKILFLYVPI